MWDNRSRFVRDFSKKGCDCSALALVVMLRVYLRHVTAQWPLGHGRDTYGRGPHGETQAGANGRQRQRFFRLGFHCFQLQLTRSTGIFCFTVATHFLFATICRGRTDIFQPPLGPFRITRRCSP